MAVLVAVVAAIVYVVATVEVAVTIAVAVAVLLAATLVYVLVAAVPSSFFSAGCSVTLDEGSLYPAVNKLFYKTSQLTAAYLSIAPYGTRL